MFKRNDEVMVGDWEGGRRDETMFKGWKLLQIVLEGQNVWEIREVVAEVLLANLLNDGYNTHATGNHPKTPHNNPPSSTTKELHHHR